MTATQCVYVVCTDAGLFWGADALARTVAEAQRFPDIKAARAMRTSLNKALGGHSWKVSPLNDEAAPPPPGDDAIPVAELVDDEPAPSPVPRPTPPPIPRGSEYHPATGEWTDADAEPKSRRFVVRCPCCRRNLNLTLKKRVKTI